MKYMALLAMIAVVALGCGDASITAATLDETVRVRSGVLAGTRADEGDVLIFKGVPFAAPPMGELRWRPPQPAADWDEPRPADEFGPSCMQNLARSRPPWTEPFMVQGDASEDCLYLNIWTAADNTDERRPVLVYIHGGGFNEGSGSIDVYDGEALSRKGPVVVTINYRLGPFGLLAHPALTAESPHNASGNYGLLDQIAALEWVRDNIAGFGGDPDRVTIAGQSAGAMSVVLLTASPLASGLFHQVIVQSGPGALASFGIVSFADLAGPLEDAEQMGTAFAERKGAETLEDLRALTAEEVMARREGDAPARYGPVVDGWFLPDDVAAIYASGRMNDVPTITGLNADEGSAFPGYGQATLDEFREQVRGMFGDRADEALLLYPAATDEEAGEMQIAAARDRAIVALSLLAEQRAETAETNAYTYYFARGIPWPERPEFAAFHTAEVPYFFDNLDKLDRPWDGLDRELADLMSTYWANFAAAGVPNGEGLPEWQAYEDAAGSFMVFDENPAMRLLPPPDRADLFRSIPSNRGQP